MWTWIITFSVYFLVLFALHKNWRAKNAWEWLHMPSNLHWLPGGLVLAATMHSVNGAGLVSGIVTREGLSGMWILWSSILGAGLFPFLFAPLWSKLKIMSENEFILLRYQGDWALRLYRFRAIYVGLFVIPIIVSFGIIAATDLIQVIFPEAPRKPLMLSIGGALVLNSMRASLHEKSRSDLLHLILLIIPIGVALVHGFNAGLNPAPTQVSLTHNANPALIWVYFGVQWWSAVIYDGSGVEAQQLIGRKSRLQSMLTGITSQVILLMISSAICIIALFAQTSQGAIGDDAYIIGLRYFLPDWLFPIFVLGILGSFLSTTESLQNWGAGMLAQLSMIKKVRKRRQVTPIMALIALIAGLIALNIQTLEDGLELILGITAGVGIIYFARWFWWRVNAPVQLMAMMGAICFVPLAKLLIFNLPHLSPVFGGEHPAMIILVSMLNLTLMAITMLLTNSDADRTQFKIFTQGFTGAGVQPSSASLLHALLFGVTLLLLQISLWVALF